METVATTLSPQELIGLTFAEFSAYLAKKVGFHPRFHRALYRQLMATGVCDPAQEPMWHEAERGSPGALARVTAAVTSASGRGPLTASDCWLFECRQRQRRDRRRRR